MGDKRSYAAFAPEDVEDAKRGRPAVSLEPWAAAHGLTYMNSAVLGAFSPVLPTMLEYVFNACRGTLPGGRFGCVQHELEEIGLDGKGDPAVTGPYYSMHVRLGKGGLGDAFRPSFVKRKPGPREAFSDDAIWVPVTNVCLRVPEATWLPVITVRSADRLPLSHPNLKDCGLPGFRMRESEYVDESLRFAVAQAVSPLAILGAAEAGVRIFHGVVSVHRNGFVDGDDLDLLVGVAAQIAEGVATVASGWLTPQAFEIPLPPPDPTTWPGGITWPERHEVDVLNRVAVELGMTLEDPIAFHRTQPHCPVPGWALGVVRGALPGTSIWARMGFFVQARHTAGSYRSALMVRAAPGAATPLGGIHDQESDLYLEVADGIAYAWPRGRSAGALNAAIVRDAAIPTLRRLGLAPI